MIPEHKKPRIVEKPRTVWTDRIARWLRKNALLQSAYSLFAKRLVPLLLAIFVVAPIGLLILPFFIPKFIRNVQRRSRHRVMPSTASVERIKRQSE